MMKILKFLIEPNVIKREELEAAYLTLFFKGKLIQSALSTAIEP